MTDRQVRAIIYMVIILLTSVYWPAVGCGVFLCVMDFLENKKRQSTAN